MNRIPDKAGDLFPILNRQRDAIVARLGWEPDPAQRYLGVMLQANVTQWMIIDLNSTFDRARAFIDFKPDPRSSAFHEWDDLVDWGRMQLQRLKDEGAHYAELGRQLQRELPPSSREWAEAQVVSEGERLKATARQELEAGMNQVRNG